MIKISHLQSLEIKVSSIRNITVCDLIVQGTFIIDITWMVLMYTFTFSYKEYH